MQWLIDGTVHLTEICTAQKWKWRNCITALIAAGLTPDDANAYAAFAFSSDPMYQRSVSQESLTTAQYARIRVAASGNGLVPAPPNL